MKNKKGQTIYAEEIYPAEFRARVCRMGYFIVETSNAVWMISMPAVVTGWVQDEVHLQMGWQSLQ